MLSAAADDEPADDAGTVAGGFVFEVDAVVGYDAAGFGASGFFGGAFI